MSRRHDKHPVMISGGRVCPQCRQFMQRYRHADDWRPAPGRGYYIFWDHCACGHTQHYGEAHRSPPVEGGKHEADA